MGSALPGPPVSTPELLERLQSRFAVDVRRQGTALAARLGIRARHLARDLAHRHEAPRGGDSNAELAARALQAALSESGVGPNDLSYLIAHTTTPGSLLPANVAQVADRIGYRADRLSRTLCGAAPGVHRLRECAHIRLWAPA